MNQGGGSRLRYGETVVWLISNGVWQFWFSVTLLKWEADGTVSFGKWARWFHRGIYMGYMGNQDYDLANQVLWVILPAFLHTSNLSST